MAYAAVVVGCGVGVYSGDPRFCVLGVMLSVLLGLTMEVRQNRGMSCL